MDGQSNTGDSLFAVFFVQSVLFSGNHDSLCSLSVTKLHRFFLFFIYLCPVDSGIRSENTSVSFWTRHLVSVLTGRCRPFAVPCVSDGCVDKDCGRN